jgi:hypothetical protein
LFFYLRKEIIMSINVMTFDEINEVSGARALNGYDGAGAIMGVVGFGSLFTPIGPITAGIAIGSAGGLGFGQFLADMGSGSFWDKVGGH